MAHDRQKIMAEVKSVPWFLLPIKWIIRRNGTFSDFTIFKITISAYDMWDAFFFDNGIKVVISQKLFTNYHHGNLLEIRYFSCETILTEDYL